MKSSLIELLYSKFKYLVEVCWSGQNKADILYPHCVEDLVDILGQARENQTQVKVVGGTFPLPPTSKEDIVVSLSCMDKLLGLDVHQQTVTAEPGVRLSVLSGILETVAMTLQLTGPVPDLSLVDAIAIGLTGCSGSLSASIISVEVVLPGARASNTGNDTPGGGTRGPELAAWSWSTHPDKMSALFSGLGMVACITSVTLKCIPLYRVSEVSSLLYLHDVLDSWNVMSGETTHQLTWFPFSDLVIFKQTKPVERSASTVQSIINRKLTTFSQLFARFVRILNLVFFSNTFVGCTLARIQFISLWSAAKNRSSYSHSPMTILGSENVRGSSWIIPLASLPPLLTSLKHWANAHPAMVASPLQVTTLHDDSRVCPHPYMYPRLPDHDRSLTSSSVGLYSPISSSARSSPRIMSTVTPPPPTLQRAYAAMIWYDWFVSEHGADPRDVANLEELFRASGGIRCWSSDRIVSPLMLSVSFSEYASWCKVKYELDPENLLASGYVQGEVWCKPVHQSKSRNKATRSPNKDTTRRQYKEPLLTTI